MSHKHAYKIASKLRDFPGHLNKGISLIQRRLRNVDCVIEVHDARAPFSGRSIEFKKSVCNNTESGFQKPYILVLNKKDLTERREQRQVLEELRLKENMQHVLFTNCHDDKCDGVKQLLPLAHELIATAERQNQRNANEYTIMMLGVPNVGKRSLLKRLCFGKENKKNIAAMSGKSIQGCVRVGQDPPVFIYEVPSIMEPTIKDSETGMKMALIGCLSNQAELGEERIAGFLLDWLNKNRRYKYVQTLGLSKPTDCIMELLIAVANRHRIQRKLKKIDGHILVVPDTLRASRYFLKLFHEGQLGSINLDKNNSQSSPCRSVL